MKWIMKSRMSCLDFSYIESLELLEELLILKSLFCLAIAIFSNLNVDFYETKYYFKCLHFCPLPGCSSEYSLCN